MSFTPPNIADISHGTQIGSITINQKFVDSTGDTCVHQQDNPLRVGVLYTIFVPDNRSDPNTGTCVDTYPVQYNVLSFDEAQDGQEFQAKIIYTPKNSGANAADTLRIEALPINTDNVVNVTVKNTSLYGFIAICIVFLLAIGYFMTR